MTALVLTAASPGSTLDRWDKAADSGPWAVVVRRRDGALGRHSAVVTFPATGSAAGREVAVGGVTGRASPGEVSWPVAGAHARIRGDLQASVLVAIASAMRVEAGRPAVRPPAGYTVVSEGPYRSRHIREVRYEGSRFEGLGGLVYTGVADLGGFEDQLYTMSVTNCGAVRGRPAVASTVGGGNGTLAWEVAPGLVGYLGLSSAPVEGPVLGAMYRLTNRTRIIDDRGWRATRPQVVGQRNDF